MSLLSFAVLAVAAGISSAAAAAASCVPGLHIYSLMALLAPFAAAPSFAHADGLLPAVWMAAVAGYAIGSSVPAVLLSSPDESAVLASGPGRRFVLEGRANDAVLLSALGAMAAAAVLVAASFPATRTLPVLSAVLRPHAAWVVWVAVVFLLMSEWPKENAFGVNSRARLMKSWTGPAAGLLTFALSGILGFVLFYRPPVEPGNAAHVLAPAFAGLFAVPWLVASITWPARIPEQAPASLRLVPARMLCHGAAAGVCGGAFAAFFPAITGGIGSLFAGHAASLRNRKTFLVSQGAARMTYYAGGLLLFFMPRSPITRGGAAWMLNARYEPVPATDLPASLAGLALGAAAGLLMVMPLARGTAAILRRFGAARVSAASLAAIAVLVFLLTGFAGLCIAAVASAIGMIPLAFGSRRMTALGVLLLPMACSLSGHGTAAAEWLGLL